MYKTKYRPLSESEKAEHIKRFTGMLSMLRAKAHISQTTLGDIVGTSRQYVSAVERGDLTLSWAKYLAMAYFFCTCEDTSELASRIVPEWLFNKAEGNQEKG